MARGTALPALGRLQRRVVSAAAERRAARRRARCCIEEADRRAKRLGMSRRAFLRTAAGTATAYMVLNNVHGLDQTGDAAPLPVTPEQCDDPEAARELFERRVLRHGRAAPPRRPRALQQPSALASCASSSATASRPTERLAASLAAQHGQGGLRRQRDRRRRDQRRAQRRAAAGRDHGRDARPGERARRIAARAVAGDVRSAQAAGHARRRSTASSTRCASSGRVALKCYTGNGAWWLDDEEVAYPMLEEATRLGLRVDQRAQGLPAAARPDGGDLRAEPRPAQGLARLAAARVRRLPLRLLSRARASTEFLERRRARSAAGATSTPRSAAPSPSPSPQGPRRPRISSARCCRCSGPERIIWGTDSIWWGSPQWQIEAFKALTIPPAMQEEFGYPPLTERAKRQILGLNAARLYRVKVREARCAIEVDQLTRCAPTSAVPRRRVATSSTARAPAASSCACSTRNGAAERSSPPAAGAAERACRYGERRQRCVASDGSGRAGSGRAARAPSRVARPWRAALDRHGIVQSMGFLFVDQMIAIDADRASGRLRCAGGRAAAARGSSIEAVGQLAAWIAMLRTDFSRGRWRRWSARSA